MEKVFTDKDEVLNVIEKAILLFREQGITGERFAGHLLIVLLLKRTEAAAFPSRVAGHAVALKTWAAQKH